MLLFIMESGMDRYKFNIFFYCLIRSIDLSSAPKLFFFLSGCCHQGLLREWIHRGDFTRLQKRGISIFIFIFALDRKQLIPESFLFILQIDIMKRLRHPNVLLFMGAVYSQERLAIVTELLPR